MNSSPKALVVGASGSIGSAVSGCLLNKGYEVLGTFHDNPNSVPSECKTLQVDLREPQNGVERILEKLRILNWESLHLLVNAAGVTKDTLFLSLKSADWSTVRKVNLDSNFYLASKLGDLLQADRANSRSYFVVSTSLSGLQGRKGQTNYSASKSALTGFILSLAREWSPDVLVNAIRPPLTESKLTKNLDDSKLDDLQQSDLIPELSSPEEYLRSLEYILGQDDLTGQIVSADHRILSPW
jgi:3-oxoacyl-[acyl-carrier protein] reductase